MQQQTPIIQLQNVSKNFGQKQILKNIDLNINKQQSLIIIGSSGCGKSVLLKIIIGLLNTTNGTIKFNDQKINNLTTQERTKIGMSIGMLFQYAALFDSLTVLQNVAFGLTHSQNKISQKLANEIASEKIAEVGLNPNQIKNLYPAELSGGMKKRIGLARAIAIKPKILFFDEPTTGLDPIMGRLIDELIVKSVEKTKATAITITHDLESAKRIGDTAAMLHDGQIVWQGNIKNLDTDTNTYLTQFRNAETQGPIKLPIKKL